MEGQRTYFVVYNLQHITKTSHKHLILSLEWKDSFLTNTPHILITPTTAFHISLEKSFILPTSVFIVQNVYAKGATMKGAQSTLRKEDVQKTWSKGQACSIEGCAQIKLGT